MALPEHAPRIPHIPVPDLKGGARWLGNHWPALTGAAVTVAGAGVAYQMFTGTDKGPQTNPPEPNKASDPFKPPAGDSGVVITPPQSGIDNPPGAAVGSDPDGGTGEPPKLTPPDILPGEKESKSGILSAKAETTGKFYQWKVSSGDTITGMGFKLKAGEEIRIPEALKVAVVQIKQPNTYNGYRVDAISADGKRKYTIFLSGVNWTAGLTNVGQALDSEALVGTFTDNKDTIFPESDINALVVFPTDDEMNQRFPNETKTPPEVISNTPRRAMTGSGSTQHDVPAPLSGG